jgi:O-antigen ligase
VLTVAAELGLPGVLLLIAAVSVTAYGAIRSVLKRPAFARPVGAGLAAAFIGLAAANSFYEVWMDDFQWVLFGLVIAALKPVEIPERRRVPGVSTRPAARARALR